jgi:hypothetical protein
MQGRAHPNARPGFKGLIHRCDQFGALWLQVPVPGPLPALRPLPGENNHAFLQLKHEFAWLPGLHTIGT